MATFMQVCDAFPDESGDLQKDFKALKNYVFQLQEALRYVLCNLGGENFNETDLANITQPILAKIEDVDGNVTQLEITAQGLQASVEDAQGNISSLQQTAQGLRTDVDDAKGNASQALQTANGLASRVTDAEGNASEALQTANGFSSRISDVEGNVTEIQTTIEGVTVTTGGGTTYLAGDKIVMSSYTNNYSQLTATGFEVYVEGSRKALLGENPNMSYINQALILGTDNPGYVTKYYNNGHRLWIGNGAQTCGIMFDFTNGTYKLYGTQT